MAVENVYQCLTSVHDLWYPPVIKLRFQVLNVFSTLLFRRAKNHSGHFRAQLLQNEEGKGNLPGV